MKKWILPALITLAQTSLWAQPVATSANVAVSNFNAEFYYSPAANFTPGPAGANQTWDFSNSFEMTLAGTDEAIPVAGSPFASSFPTANYLYKFSGMFGGDRYYYHNLTASKLEILSLGWNGVNGDNYTANPRTFAVFPYTYGTEYTDTYRSSADNIDVTNVVTYDAYGTLIMPFGTFHNVIRQKVVENGHINYNWFNVQPFYPILQTVLEENSLGIVKNLTLGTDQFAAGKMFAVYPNPTKDELNIEAIGTITSPVEIEIYDLLGKRIFRKEESLNNDLVQVNLASYDAGIYLLKMTDTQTGASHTQKIVKK